MVRQTNYIHALNRRNWVTWLWATVGALVMNVVLFTLLPYLLQPATKPVFDQLIPQVTMIRLKRPESPIKRKKIEPPKQNKPKQRPRAPDKPVSTKLTMPFELAPGLPGGPAALELPVVKNAFATKGPRVFDSSDLDRPLVVLSRMPPVYPTSARHRGIQGWVTVRFIVTEEGDVDELTIIESEPPGVFDQSVISCVKSWRFKPGTVSGRPVKARAETTLRFELE